MDFGIALGELESRQDFAEMGLNSDLFYRRIALPDAEFRLLPFATNVPGERSLFHPSMNPGLFESSRAAAWACVNPGSALPLGKVQWPLPVRTSRNSTPLLRTR